MRFRRDLFFRFGLFQTDHTVTFCPLATLAEQVHALEALEDSTILFSATDDGLKAIMLRHD